MFDAMLIPGDRSLHQYVLKPASTVPYIAKPLSNLDNVKSFEALRYPSLPSSPFTCTLASILKVLVSARWKSANGIGIQKRMHHPTLPSPSLVKHHGTSPI